VIGGVPGQSPEHIERHLVRGVPTDLHDLPRLNAHELADRLIQAAPGVVGGVPSVP
jgi:hypothetical protein